MPVLFRDLCDLLSGLEAIARRHPPYLPECAKARSRASIASWTSHHKVNVRTPQTELVAILSNIFPASRSDRVYNLQHQKLLNLLKRCLGLGLERAKALDRWLVPGNGDLADCLERVLAQTDDPQTLVHHKITVDDVDNALTAVAAKCRFSDSRIQRVEADAQLLLTLENLFRSLHSRDAKWLVRILLKDFSCIEDVMNNPNMVYAAIDHQLPEAVVTYSHFEDAIRELKAVASSSKPASFGCHSFRPRIGSKVGPATFIKAKGGVQHMMTLTRGRAFSVEKKYDGEYCQIHVDLTQARPLIQIFSKSGKDSTQDRSGVHAAILNGLRVGETGCLFSRYCIVEGEMLLWSEKDNMVLDFCKIRKHVSRSGTFIGTSKDSQPHEWERLMVMFYDVLLLDDDPVLMRPYEERRAVMKQLVDRQAGQSDYAWRQLIDFSQLNGQAKFEKRLADSFARRWEGLVLKPATCSYFGEHGPGHSSRSAWIKIKKDCIDGLGDTMDFAVIGAGYQAEAAAKSKLTRLKWTHFFLACIENKTQLLKDTAKPSLLVFDCINTCLKDSDLKTINDLGQFREVNAKSPEARQTFDFKYTGTFYGLPKMTTVFRKPFIFEIAGSGFDRSQERDFWTLRFPRVVKIHWDRDWKNSTSLQEVNKAVEDAALPQEMDLREETRRWRKKLKEVTRKPGVRVNAWNLTDDENDRQQYSKPASRGETSAPSGSTAGRSSRKASLPMVRMDSMEMRCDEQRMSDGSVVPVSTSYRTSKVNSLPTPPTSSAQSARVNEQPVKGLQSYVRRESPPRKRKRSLDVSCGDLTATPPIKANIPLCPIPRQRSSVTRFSPLPPPTVLQEVVNSSSPSFSQPSPFHISPQRTTSESSPFLVRKIKVGAHEADRRKYRKRLKEMASDSIYDTEDEWEGLSDRDDSVHEDSAGEVQSDSAENVDKPSDDIPTEFIVNDSEGSDNVIPSEDANKTGAKDVVQHAQSSPPHGEPLRHIPATGTQGITRVDNANPAAVSVVGPTIDYNKPCPQHVDDACRAFFQPDRVVPDKIQGNALYVLSDQLGRDNGFNAHPVLRFRSELLRQQQAVTTILDINESLNFLEGHGTHAKYIFILPARTDRAKENPISMLIYSLWCERQHVIGAKCTEAWVWGWGNDLPAALYKEHGSLILRSPDEVPTVPKHFVAHVTWWHDSSNMENPDRYKIVWLNGAITESGTQEIRAFVASVWAKYGRPDYIRANWLKME